MLYKAETLLLKTARATLKKAETHLRYVLAKKTVDPIAFNRAQTELHDAQAIYDKCLAAHPDRKS